MRALLAQESIDILHADAHGVPLDIDSSGFALLQRLRQSRLNIAEGHRIDGDVVAAPFLRQRLGHTERDDE